ncbi:MAG: zinc ribbon domain-containing protein [Thermoplasmata archaeon]|nr:zinc ribbon domain-containing protein [Thermoplasmata archaeon]
MSDVRGAGESDLSPPQPRSMMDALRKSRYKPLIIVIIGGLIFALGIFVDICLAGSLLSITLIILYWYLRVDNIWQQLGIGVAAFCVATLVAASAVLPIITDVPESNLHDIGNKMIDGKVTPLRGDAYTNYIYTISVIHNNASANISVYVNITENDLMGVSNERNETMNLVSDPYKLSNTSWQFNYSYKTKLDKLINAYKFQANISGTWYEAGFIQGSSVIPEYGPVSSDSLAIFGSLALAYFIFIFGWAFLPFLILVLFLRFSMRSREARTKMLDDYRKMKVERAGAATGKPETKKEEETFICSECGAEVQASAKFCPNCGEPFEEDEPQGIKIELKKERDDEFEEKKY